MDVSIDFLSSVFPHASTSSAIYLMGDFEFSGFAPFGGVALPKAHWPHTYTNEWASGVVMGKAKHAFDSATHTLLLSLRCAQFAAFEVDICFLPCDIHHAMNLQTKREHVLPAARVRSRLGMSASRAEVRVCMLDHSLVISSPDTRITLALPVKIVEDMKAFRAPKVV